MLVVVGCHLLAIVYAAALTASVYEKCDDEDTIFVSNRLWLMLMSSIGLVYTTLILIGKACRCKWMTDVVVCGTIFIGISLCCWMIVGILMIVDKHHIDSCKVSDETIAIDYIVLLSFPILVGIVCHVFKIVCYKNQEVYQEVAAN